MSKVRITLEIEYFGEEISSPDAWDWQTLLDLGPDESVKVTEFEEVMAGEMKQAPAPVSEPEEERWKFRWEEVGYGANRDEALLNAVQWMDRHSPCGEVLLKEGESDGFNRVMAAMPDIIRAVVETQVFLLTNILDRKERIRILDLLQAAMNKGAGIEKGGTK